MRAAVLKSHKQTKHGLVFQCFYCDTRFVKKEIQRKHIKTFNTKINPVGNQIVGIECVSFDDDIKYNDEGIKTDLLNILSKRTYPKRIKM